MKKILIVIHGLGNKPPKNLLCKWWLRSIHEGLNRIGKHRDKIPFEMVYWADVFYPNPMTLDIHDPKDPLYLDEPYTKGDVAVTDKNSTFKTILFQYIEDQLDKVFLNQDYSLNFSDVTDKVLQYYFSDLETYFTQDCLYSNNPKCTAKEEIRARLHKTISQYKGYKILLISHSMGSIVAFDVLSKFSNELNIDTFVTLGSPLGLPIIVERIFSEQKMTSHRLKRLYVPDCIWPHWYNLSDPEDKVALDHTLADDFAPNKKGLKAVDMLVNNDYEWNSIANPHKSYGYLRTIEMAAIIDDFLANRT